MNVHPRITIVTPSYNQAHFLEQTILSVIRQGYPNLEYIVIDGGSTDGSVDVLRKYEHAISCWISEPDQGPVDAINKGFRRATGSILAWLNADDLYQPGALEGVAAAFEADESADVVYGNTYWINRDGVVLAEKRQTPFSRLGYRYGGSDLQQPATFWRRRLFEKSGGLDPHFKAAFDTELFFRFIACGARFRHVDAFFASFRVHSEQISDVLMSTARKEVELIRSRHLKYSAHSMQGAVLRNLGRLQRVLWYLRQGDFLWLISRIPDRLKSRALNEAAGPRSKWV